VIANPARTLHFGGAVRIHHLTLVLATAACTAEVDIYEDTNATSGASITYSDRLSGCHGQASSAIPADGVYVMTTFGGGADNQQMSCGGYADGTGWYAASRQRYGCGAKLQVEANGKCVVLSALDYGPDVCVEAAAHKPILDMSPRASKALYGVSGAGWSDHLTVTVTEVAIWLLVQLLNIAVASTDPHPVTMSNPAPAEYPNDPVEQFGEPGAQGTILLPLTMSWNTLGALLARR